MSEFASGYCKNCGKKVRIERPSTSHVLHLILSVLTCGLWIPIWILCSIRIGGWRCVSCGSIVSRSLFG